jgi:hypothetical protein
MRYGRPSSLRRFAERGPQSARFLACWGEARQPAEITKARQRITNRIGDIEMADLQQLEEQIVGLSLLEAAELVKKL